MFYYVSFDEVCVNGCIDTPAADAIYNQFVSNVDSEDTTFSCICADGNDAPGLHLHLGLTSVLMKLWVKKNHV